LLGIFIVLTLVGQGLRNPYFQSIRLVFLSFSLWFIKVSQTKKKFFILAILLLMLNNFAQADTNPN